LNERDRKLDVGLLQSGKFQEALAGLAKWLTDTEDLVANQKPPSADYKVVKAQLQEQKVLYISLLRSLKKINYEESHVQFIVPEQNATGSSKLHVFVVRYGQ